MSRDRAAYMREYRANRRAKLTDDATDDPSLAARRIEELQEEVRHLKAELAKRPKGGSDSVTAQYTVAIVQPAMEHYNTRPFTPVPKRGK